MHRGVGDKSHAKFAKFAKFLVVVSFFLFILERPSAELCDEVASLQNFADFANFA